MSQVQSFIQSHQAALDTFEKYVRDVKADEQPYESHVAWRADTLIGCVPEGDPKANVGNFYILAIELHEMGEHAMGVALRLEEHRLSAGLQRTMTVPVTNAKGIEKSIAKVKELQGAPRQYPERTQHFIQTVCALRTIIQKAEREGHTLQ